MPVKRVTKNSRKSFFGGGMGALIPLCPSIQSASDQSSSSHETLTASSRKVVTRSSLKSTPVMPISPAKLAEAREAACRGDRIGAPWEGNVAHWHPVAWEHIDKRSRMYPNGTDESDLVRCVQGFRQSLDLDPTCDEVDSEVIRLAWAHYLEQNRRCTKYGGGWKLFFLRVRALTGNVEQDGDRMDKLAAEDGGDRKGGRGNGFLSLALPLWDLARWLGFTRGWFVQRVAEMSHAHPEALGSLTFLCSLFDWLDTGREIETGCAAVKSFYGQQLWELEPHAFVERYSYNALADIALIHVLYALCTVDSEQDLIERVVSMGGDADSTLALALMLHTLAQSVSHFHKSFWQRLPVVN